MAEGSQSPEVPTKATPQRKHDREQKPIADIRVIREAQFPEDAEKRFEAVFASIGNSEAKCLTLLCLSESPITPPDLRARFMRETSNVWAINYSGPSEYCKDTLVPIGLVAEADVLYSGSDEYITGYRLTGAGKTFGHPISAFLLKESDRLPYSLLTLFGQTSKTGGETRSVVNRARILEHLTLNPTNVRQMDVSQSLGLNHTVVSNHLRHLFRLGLIDYSSIGPEDKGMMKFAISHNADDIEVDGLRGVSSPLTKGVMEALKAVGVADAHTLAEVVKESYPDKASASLAQDIGRILSELSKKGYCQRELFSKKTRSDVKITDAGVAITSDVIVPIKRALNGDTDLLASWQSINWQDLAKNALVKYRNESGHANAISEAERLGRALEIINQNPGIRPRELGLSLQYVPTNLLKTLLENGKIRKERQGSGVAYFPVSGPVDKTT